MKPSALIFLSALFSLNAFADAVSLAPMQLTRAEVAAREKKLKPIFDYYGKTSVGQVANALEEIYGLNVYQHIAGVQWPGAALSNKKGIMAAAVQASLTEQNFTSEHDYNPYRGYYSSSTSYYLTTPSCPITGGFALATDGRLIASGTEIVRASAPSFVACTLHTMFGLTARNLLNRVSAQELGIQDRVEATQWNASQLQLIKGKEGIPNIAKISPFTLLTTVEGKNRTVMSGFDPLKLFSLGLASRPFSGFGTRDYALYSTLENSAVLAPQLFRFLVTLKRLQIKALDATVVFMNSDYLSLSKGVGKPWLTVYPNFSSVAPIPQPIIYIGEGATDSDMETLIRQEAPLIYVYNKLFDANLLPLQTDIAASLAKVSHTNPELAAMMTKVGRMNSEEAARRAYLILAYGALHSTTSAVHGAGLAVREVGNTVTNVFNAVYDILDQETFSETLMASTPYGMVYYTSTSTR
mgnify:CR=1 FL=1